MRSMDLHVTCCAIGVLSVLIVLWPSGFDGTDIMSNAVTSQTELIDRAELQQSWI
jgi:hypothetical protein